MKPKGALAGREARLWDKIARGGVCTSQLSPWELEAVCRFIDLGLFKQLCDEPQEIKKVLSQQAKEKREKRRQKRRAILIYAMAFLFGLVFSHLLTELGLIQLVAFDSKFTLWG